MKNSFFAEASFTDLFHGLTSDLKRFIREESELTKREMSEKFSCYTRNAITLVIGVFVAYAGFIVFLGALGNLLGSVFQKLGLNPLLGTCIGLGITGLLIVLTGAALILKGGKALSTSSLAPKRTIATIKHLKVAGEIEKTEPHQKKEAPKRSVEELQREAMGTRERIGEELEEIAYRTSPARMKHLTVENMQTHPFGWGVAAFVTGFASSLLLARKLRKAWSSG